MPSRSQLPLRHLNPYNYSLLRKKWERFSIVYEMVDEFSTPVSAGSVNGTTADGTGQVRTVTDSANYMSVTEANGLITSTVVAGNAHIWHAGLTTKTGLAIGWRVRILANSQITVGTDSNQSAGLRNGIYFYVSNILRVMFDGQFGGALSKVYSYDTDYDVVVVQRPAGKLLYIRGGAFTTWTLAGVGYVDNHTPVYSGITNIGGAFSASVARAAVLPAYKSDWVTATHVATTTDGQIAAAESGNAIIEHTITATTGVTQELMVRRVDDDNCIIIRMDQAGSTIKVIKKEAGVETELDSAAQTWTNATVYRVHVSLYGSNIITRVELAFKNDTTSTYNQTETGVKVSHVGADLGIWQSNPTGTPLSQLDAFFPA